MNSKDIDLKSGWIKIEKSELDKLREKMRGQYEFEGGSKKFNSHLPNYEELRSIIKTRLNAMMKEKDFKITIQGQEQYEIVPGNTFFRDLFFTKKNSANSQFQEYNIEVCFLFAYGRTRLEQLNFEKNQNKGFPKNLDLSDEQSRMPKNKGEYKIIISSTINNMVEAENLKNHISEKFGFNVETDTRNSHTYKKGSLESLYNTLDEKTIVFNLISRDYLQNENCLKELIEFTENNLELYLNHTLHILTRDIYAGDFSIFDSLGRSELLKYWVLRIGQLEENHKILIKEDKKEKDFYKNLRQDLIEIKKIIEGLHKLIDLIRQSSHSIVYDLLISKAGTFEELKKIMPRRKALHPIDRKLELTYKRIKIPSNNDPNYPEFPPEPFYKPRFPASETYQIEVPGFSNIWLKDESSNPTGTHKDRLAWEVVIKYKSLIEGLKYKDDESLPQMSLISSGSAAISIQHLFNLFNIPTKLKVLAGRNLNEKIKSDIKEIGCELYEYNLSEKLLGPDDIKKLTNNENGIDITYREALDPAHDNYYDWLSYEIIREKPQYCFIPFGTGDLYINVLNIVKQEYFNSFVQKHDPRFFSDIDTLKNCQFMGASSNNPNTRLDKLFSYFLPSIDSFRRFINELKSEYGCVGDLTNFYFVKEKYVGEAMEIANSQNIKYEPSGIAGLALLLQMKGSIPPGAKILIVNTGRTKKLDELIKPDETLLNINK